MHKGDFRQHHPYSLWENIQSNFLKELDSVIDKSKKTLIISNEAIFNIIRDIPLFSPINQDKSPNGFALDNILEVFKSASQKWTNAILFINFVYSKTRTLDNSRKQKIGRLNACSQQIMNKILNSTGKFFKYIAFPFLESQKMEPNFSTYLDIKNKTYVFSAGKVIATHRKRWMDENDFGDYDTTTEVRYFNSGFMKCGKIKNPFFLKAFKLDICLDNKLTEDLEHKKDFGKPLIHIIQSNTLSDEQTDLRTGILIKVDSHEDRTHLEPIKGQIMGMDSDMTVKKGNFTFRTWNNIKIKGI